MISKPAGLLSQGEISGTPNNVVDILRKRWGHDYVGLIHRLDRNTSGLMVIAKRSKAAERLSEQLRQGDLVRHYHGLVFGELPLNQTKTWEHQLRSNPENNRTEITRAATDGKTAILRCTGIRSIEHLESGVKSTLTWARFELETGRKHQIRAQSNAMRHPLVGDLKYSSSCPEAIDFNRRLGAKFARPALHSCFLAFSHPIQKVRLEFFDSMPTDIRHVFFAPLET